MSKDSNSRETSTFTHTRCQTITLQFFISFFIRLTTAFSRFSIFYLFILRFAIVGSFVFCLLLTHFHIRILVWCVCFARMLWVVSMNSPLHTCKHIQFVHWCGGNSRTPVNEIQINTHATVRMCYSSCYPSNWEKGRERESAFVDM